MDDDSFGIDDIIGASIHINLATAATIRFGDVVLPCAQVTVAANSTVVLSASGSPLDVGTLIEQIALFADETSGRRMPPVLITCAGKAAQVACVNVAGAFELVAGALVAPPGDLVVVTQPEPEPAQVVNAERRRDAHTGEDRIFAVAAIDAGDEVLVRVS